MKKNPRQLYQELKTRTKAQHRSLNEKVIATPQASNEGADTRTVTELIEGARASRAEFRRTLTLKELQTWKIAGRS